MTMSLSLDANLLIISLEIKHEAGQTSSRAVLGPTRRACARRRLALVFVAEPLRTDNGTGVK